MRPQISLDRLRELLAAGEGDRLDYKSEAYDNNPELAKDIACIANNLCLGEDGFVLLGVEEQPDKTGRAVAGKLDVGDADLHRKPSAYLNRLPDFSAYPMAIDQCVVGVIHIRGSGQRPYYPVRDSDKSLQKDVPRRRRGSNTEVASPDEVLRWYREDAQGLPSRQQIELIPAEDWPMIELHIGFLTDSLDEMGVSGLPMELVEIDLPGRSLRIRLKNEASFATLPLEAVRMVAREKDRRIWRIEADGYLWRHNHRYDYRSHGRSRR